MMNSMKKLLPALPLLLMAFGTAVPLTALARWEAVLLADKGLFHYDPSSLTSSGLVRSFRSMVDYKAPQDTSDGKTYLSTVTEIQLNCKSHVARIVHLSYHAEGMGLGKEVRKEGMIRDWLEIPAGSPIERIAKRVC